MKCMLLLNAAEMEVGKVYASKMEVCDCVEGLQALTTLVW